MRVAKFLPVLVTVALAAGCAAEDTRLSSSAAVSGQNLHLLVESSGLPHWHPPVAGLPEGHPPVRSRPALPEGHPPIPGYGLLPEGHPPVCPALSSGSEAAGSAPPRPARPAGHEVIRI
jgi:hypothetical protein